MRLRGAYAVGFAVLASALAPPASAQIISTSIPYADRGISAGKGATFHIMVSPFAKWKYGEVYVGPLDDILVVGSVSAEPNSDFLLAGEAAFALGENSPWSLTLGGWYNKVGKTDYALAGTFLVDLPFPFNVGDITADLGGDLNLYEGHVGFFYKDFGVQAGVVKTTGKIGATAKNVRIAFTAFPDQPGDLGDFLDIPEFESDTTDWDLFGVYKKGGEKWNASIGAGIYGKQGITDGSPLRNAENKTVFSAFVSANVEIWKGLGIDASYWYIGSTGTVESDLADLGAIDSDSQNRLTFGIGYSF